MATSKQQQQSSKETKASYNAPVGSVRPASNWKPAQEALADIENTFGFMPEFVNIVNDKALVGAWNEAKNVYFNPHTSLEPKLKNLISLAVASQIPCDMMRYFETIATLRNGATPQHQSDAVLIASLTRHWSIILNGSMMDKAAFKKETDQIAANVKKMMQDLGDKLPPEENFLVKFSSAAEAYKDIEKTLGLVPKFFLSFPEIGVADAWSEFKAVHINPHTALDNKQKELIGLAVASQIPCDYCIYFHHTFCKLHGATDKEIQEAIAVAAMDRHWSTVFHGSGITLERFQENADRMLNNLSSRGLAS